MIIFFTGLGKAIYTLLKPQTLNMNILASDKKDPYQVAGVQPAMISPPLSRNVM